MMPTEELMEDHRVIERMLAVLFAGAARAERGQELPSDFFPKAVDFIRTFADKTHHGKEEDFLYPAMEKRGIPQQGGPIGVMLMEHDQGRAYVRGMDEAGQKLKTGDKEAMRAAVRNARAYADLLSTHIGKEDNILYAMADSALTPADQKELEEKFKKVETERLGNGKREEYLVLVEDLERELGIRK